MERLHEKKLELLAEQKGKSDLIHQHLTGQDGLNEVSRKTCKNLEAAVAASKNPGIISYYEQPDGVKKLVSDKQLQKLQSSIMKIQQDIEQVEEEIREKRKSEKSKRQMVLNNGTSAPSKNVSSLSQWFSTYGTPKPTTSGLLTSFCPNTKVYGGTNHYSAFKTQSRNMKKGRLTK